MCSECRTTGRHALGCPYQEEDAAEYCAGCGTEMYFTDEFELYEDRVLCPDCMEERMEREGIENEEHWAAINGTDFMEGWR